MADNYLEYAREDYERRKQLLAKKPKTRIFGSRALKTPRATGLGMPRPDDESL